MASLNMANMNTLIRKGYLLAWVIMAANMFAVNEMKAMDPPSINPNDMNNDMNNNMNNTQKIEYQDFSDKPAPQPKNFFGSLLFGFLSCEGRINFFGGLFFSVANNYLKWWDYNPGGYWNLRIGCLGLRSKRFLNGMLQFEGNLNLIRGTLWLIPGIFELIQYLRGEKEPRKSTAGLIMLKILEKVKGNEPKFGFFYSIFFLVQGFVSIPLTLHFSKFSISISLDSIIWGLTGMILAKKKVILTNHNIEEDILANKVDKVNNNEDDNEIKENNLINKDSEENK